MIPGMARDVYVVGSVNVDLVVRAATLPAPGETVTGGTFERHGGGKSANQAVAAARQGAAVRMVGAVGDDDLGEEAVAAAGGRGHRRGGRAAARVCADRRGADRRRRRGREPDRGRLGRQRRAVGRRRSKRALDAAPRRAASCCSGLEVPDAAVLAGARAARAAGLEVVVNPAPARPLPGELLALSPVLTPNGGEAAALERRGRSRGGRARAERRRPARRSW